MNLSKYQAVAYRLLTTRRRLTLDEMVVALWGDASAASPQLRESLKVRAQKLVSRLRIEIRDQTGVADAIVWRNRDKAWQLKTKEVL